MAKGLVLHAFGKTNKEILACLKDLVDQMENGRALEEGNARSMIENGTEYDWDLLDTDKVSLTHFMNTIERN